MTNTSLCHVPVEYYFYGEDTDMTECQTQGYSISINKQQCPYSLVNGEIEKELKKFHIYFIM